MEIGCLSAARSGLQEVLECGVEQRDAVNLQIEVRSATHIRFGKITIFHDFGVADVIRIGVDVSKVRGDVACIVELEIVGLKGIVRVVNGDSKGAQIIDMARTSLELGLGSLNGFRSAGRRRRSR